MVIYLDIRAIGSQDCFISPASYLSKLKVSNPLQWRNAQNNNLLENDLLIDTSGGQLTLTYQLVNEGMCFAA